MSVLLDSTVLIDVLRGRPHATDKLKALRRFGDVPFTTPINVEEIHRGLRGHERTAADRLFNGLRVIPISRREGALAGEWRRDHAARGTTLPQADCLIAAVAVTVGVPLATGNPKDFPIAALDVHHWPVGE